MDFCMQKKIPAPSVPNLFESPVGKEDGRPPTPPTPSLQIPPPSSVPMHTWPGPWRAGAGADTSATMDPPMGQCWVQRWSCGLLRMPRHVPVDHFDVVLTGFGPAIHFCIHRSMLVLFLLLVGDHTVSFTCSQNAHGAFERAKTLTAEIPPTPNQRFRALAAYLRSYHRLSNL